MCKSATIKPQLIEDISSFNIDIQYSIKNVMKHSIQYFIDIFVIPSSISDVFKNLRIDININIFRNILIHINIFQNYLGNINIFEKWRYINLIDMSYQYTEHLSLSGHQVHEANFHLDCSRRRRLGCRPHQEPDDQE